MSVLHMGAVFGMGVEEVTPAERLVLLALADHADGDGRSIYPSVARTCSRTSLQRRSVQRILRRLVAKNLLALTEPARPSEMRAATYRLLFDPATVGRQGGDLGSQSPRPEVALPRDPGSPESSVEPSLKQNRSRATRSKAEDDPLPLAEQLENVRAIKRQVRSKIARDAGAK